MAKNKTRTIIACAGGTMLALGITCLSLRITEWSARHHGELTIATIVGFGGAAIGAICWLLTKDDSATVPITPAPQLKMKADGNIVRSPQVGTVHGDVYMGDHGPIKSARAPQPEVKIPKLLIRSPQKVYLDCQSRVISRSGDGFPGMIVEIENPEANVGEQGIPAKGVIAKIRFLRQDGEVLGSSEYAHWLDVPENRTTILAGESRVLVVGIYDNPGAWLYFTNKIDAPVPKAVSFHQIQSYSAKLNRPLEPKRIFFNPIIDVQITLLSKYDSYTLAQKSFRLSTFTTTMGEIDFKYQELP